VVAIDVVLSDTDTNIKSINNLKLQPRLATVEMCFH